MEEKTYSKPIKAIDNINDVTSLNGYNETEFEIIKAFVNKIKEFYKPEKGKVEWINNLSNQCFNLTKYFRENKYKNYLDALNDKRILGVVNGDIMGIVKSVLIYIPKNIAINLQFNINYYDETGGQDYIFLYKFDPEKHPDNIPLMFGSEFENLTENQYCYIIMLK